MTHVTNNYETLHVASPVGDASRYSKEEISSLSELVDAHNVDQVGEAYRSIGRILDETVHTIGDAAGRVHESWRGSDVAVEAEQQLARLSVAAQALRNYVDGVGRSLIHLAIGVQEGPSTEKRSVNLATFRDYMRNLDGFFTGNSDEPIGPPSTHTKNSITISDPEMARNLVGQRHPGWQGWEVDRWVRDHTVYVDVEVL